MDFRTNIIVFFFLNHVRGFGDAARISSLKSAQRGSSEPSIFNLRVPDPEPKPWPRAFPNSLATSGPHPTTRGARGAQSKPPVPQTHRQAGRLAGWRAGRLPVSLHALLIPHIRAQMSDQAWEGACWAPCPAVRVAGALGETLALAKGNSWKSVAELSSEAPRNGATERERGTGIFGEDGRDGLVCVSLLRPLPRRGQIDGTLRDYGRLSSRRCQRHRSHGPGAQVHTYSGTQTHNYMQKD